MHLKTLKQCCIWWKKYILVVPAEKATWRRKSTLFKTLKITTQNGGSWSPGFFPQPTLIPTRIRIFADGKPR
jgi:hypothetical protein